MSREIYNRRQQNLKKALGKNGLDGMLITNLTNIRYISGFTGSAASVWLLQMDNILLQMDDILNNLNPK